MFHRGFFAVTAVLLVGAFLAIAGGQVSDKPKVEATTSPFTAKAARIVVAEVNASVDYYLTDLQVKTLGDQSLLGGAVARDKPGNLSVVRVWVPLRNVIRIEDFNSLEELKQVYKLEK